MRKFLAALIAWALICCANPAVAGVTQIVGSGTGGTIGALTGNFAGSCTTCTVNIAATTADIPVGSLAVCIVSATATGTIATASCNDGKGNTYAACSGQTGAFQNGAASRLLYSYTTNDIPSGTVIQASVTGVTNTDVEGQIIAFSGTSSSPCDSAASGTWATGSGTNTSVGPTGTLTGPGGTGTDVIIFNQTTHNSVTTTPDARLTNLIGTSATNWYAGFMIVNANTAITLTNSISGSVNYAIQMNAFKAAGGATPVCKRSLMGVGC